MTYGWVIMVALVAIGALAQFGVLSPDKFLPRKCILESGIGCMDFKVNENSAVLVLRNAKGEDITISRITAGSCSLPDPGNLKNDEQKMFIITGCANEANKKFSGEINITYTAESGLVHVQKGTLMDKVESGTSESEEAQAPETIELLIDSDTLNYNIFEEAGSPTEAVTVTLTIASGVKVGSSSTAQAALVTGNFPSGSSLAITNNGNIAGAGGRGGNAPQYVDDQSESRKGSPGGTALELQYSTSIQNLGVIGGGGGGGGGGAGWWSAGGAGGGGAGYVVGQPGNNNHGSAAEAGTLEIGGDGGSEGGAPEYYGQSGNSGPGGKGGDLGQSGDWGLGGGWGPKDPGAAGYAVKSNGNTLTWTNQGDVRGEII